MLSWRKDSTDGNVESSNPVASGGAANASNPPPSTPGSGSTRSERPVSSGRLGDMLVREGAISNGQLQEALAKQQESGKFLGQVLVDMSFITQATLVSILVKQCKIPHISLVDYDVSEALFQLVPKDLCLKFNLLPIDKLGRILTLAMVDPLDLDALEEVRKSCPDIRIKPILCDWNHFDSVAKRVFHTAQQQDVQEVTAGSFGLPEKKPAAKSKPFVDSSQTAVDAAVDALVKEAAASPTPEAVPRPRPESAAPQPNDGVKSQPASPQPTAAVSAEAVGAQASRAALQEALAPLLAEQRRMAEGIRQTLREQSAAAPAHSLPDFSALISESVRSAMADQESRLLQIAESMMQATQSAEATLRAIQEERSRADDAPASNAKIANLEIFPGMGGGELSAGQLSDAGVLDTPGMGMEADERVREAIDSDRLLSGYTFKEFLVGPSNTFTLKAARALGEKLARDFNPLYVCGDEGLGKTHLLNAVGNAALATNPDLRVAYVSTSHFSGAFGTALKHDELSEFRDRFCRWDVLLIDDIQFLAGRQEAQEELFHVFNALVHEGRIVVIAGDRPPDKLPEFQKGLISRFSSGIVTKLRPPEMDVRLAILKRYAESHRVAVSEEIMFLVATRIATDIRRMLGALRKVVAYAKLVEQEITREMANEVLDSLGAEEAA